MPSRCRSSGRRAAETIWRRLQERWPAPGPVSVGDFLDELRLRPICPKPGKLAVDVVVAGDKPDHRAPLVPTFITLEEPLTFRSLITATVSPSRERFPRLSALRCRSPTRLRETIRARIPGRQAGILPRRCRQSGIRGTGAGIRSCAQLYRKVRGADRRSGNGRAQPVSAAGAVQGLCLPSGQARGPDERSRGRRRAPSLCAGIMSSASLLPGGPPSAGRSAVRARRSGSRRRR